MADIKIMLVDDEVEFLDATATALRRRGFDVTAVSSGEEALQKLPQASPDIMVLDLKMPGLGGLDTLAAIRKRDDQLPVVILTGHGGLDEAVGGIRLGIVDFIQKPVDIDRLAAQVRRLVYRGETMALRERTLSELLVPQERYRRVYGDQPVRDVIVALEESLFQNVAGKVNERETRTVLVFGRDESFVGCVRIGTVLDLMLPTAIKGSPYASYLTGMFVAQSKLIGSQPISAIVEREPVVDAGAPLMEVLSIMVERRLINMPVVENGRLLGLVRDKDLLREVAGLVGR